jgi:hypothetical protein
MRVCHKIQTLRTDTTLSTITYPLKINLLQRLIKLASRLNIATSNLVGALQEMGHEIANKPTAKLTPEQVELVTQFFKDNPNYKSSNSLNILRRLPSSNSRIDIKRVSPPAPPPPVDLRGLQVMGEIIVNGSTKKVKPENKHLEWLKSQEQEVLLGVIVKTKEDNGYGFLQPVGRDIDIWYHVLKVKEEAVSTNAVVVFLPKKSTRHPGKWEASWLQSLSSYDGDRIQLLNWYAAHEDSLVRTALLRKMSLADRTDALLREVDHLAGMAGSALLTQLELVVQQFGLVRSGGTDIVAMVSKVDDYLPTKSNKELLFWWWFMGLGAFQIAEEVKQSVFNTLSLQKQKKVLEWASERDQTMLLEYLYKSSGTGWILNLMAVIQPELKSKLKVFLKAQLSFQEEADLFFSGKWDSINLDYLIRTSGSLSNEKLAIVLKRGVIDTSGEITLLTSMLDGFLRQALPEDDLVECIEFLHLAVSGNARSQTVAEFAGTVKKLSPKTVLRPLWERRVIVGGDDSELKDWLAAEPNKLSSIEGWHAGNLIVQTRKKR